MTGIPKEYRRLTGRPWGGMYRAALWMGPDHLLKISSNGYAEDYRRYYFQDIQAIVVKPTSAWHGRSLIFGALLVLFGLITLTGMANPTELEFILCAVLAVLFGALLAINLLRGPSCVCFIRTAVQTDKIESLRRLQTARKVLPILSERILEAQGGFTAADQAVIEALTIAKPERKEEPAAVRIEEEVIEGAEKGNGAAPHPTAAPEPEPEREHADGGNGKVHTEAESPVE